MPLAKVIRHSPLYLYLKLYSLSLLVTVFASAPVTRRLNRDHLQRIEQIRRVTEETFHRKIEGQSRYVSPSSSLLATTREIDTRRYQEAELQEEKNVKHHARIADSRAKKTKQEKRAYSNSPFPYALKTLALDADTRFPILPLQNYSQKIGRVIRRWGRRFTDLGEVKRSVESDQTNTKRFPELRLKAHVRCSHNAHPQEHAFLLARSRHIVESKLFKEVMEVEERKTVDPKDLPTLAIGGSGGGYRATFGFMSSLEALQSKGILDVTHWLAGVSGSCWTIASMYTISNLNLGKLISHCKSVAQEGFHPMSRQALDAVARSSKGVYFLLAPLLSKVRSGVVGIGIMDMYATLTTSYQLLSRSPHARPRLSQSTFQFSKIWDGMRLSKGLAPMPIFTAVRVRHDDDKVVKIQEEEVANKVHTPYHHSDSRSLVPTNFDRETDAIKARENAFPSKKRGSKIKYQWWEMSPLEVGSSDEGAWIPTWSYGRSFLRGSSTSTAPEISLSLLLGQATSAPAGPLTGYISTILATLPKGTIMSFLLSKINNFVQLKRWERRWGNPIRGADEPNPLHGTGSRWKIQGDQGTGVKEWEKKKRFKLMDSGLSNNLPNHIFTSQARKADIIISFDQSSDVQTGAALLRLNEFALERNVVLMARDLLPELLPPHPLDEKGRKDSKGVPLRKVLSSEEIESRFKGRYAQVFVGWYRDELVGKEDKTRSKAGLLSVDERKEFTTTDSPHFYLLYCPLLPHHCQPSYDPVTAPFSTSYNLVWSPEEIEVISKTANGNAIDYIIPALKQVYQSVYENKRKRRIENQKSTRNQESTA